jgi:hypothetical protein
MSMGEPRSTSSASLGTHAPPTVPTLPFPGFEGPLSRSPEAGAPEHEAGSDEVFVPVAPPGEAEAEGALVAEAAAPQAAEEVGPDFESMLKEMFPGKKAPPKVSAGTSADPGPVPATLAVTEEAEPDFEGMLKDMFPGKKASVGGSGALKAPAPVPATPAATEEAESDFENMLKDMFPGKKASSSPGRARKTESLPVRSSRRADGTRPRPASTRFMDEPAATTAASSSTTVHTPVEGEALDFDSMLGAMFPGKGSPRSAPPPTRASTRHSTASTSSGTSESAPSARAPSRATRITSMMQELQDLEAKEPAPPTSSEEQPTQ